MKTQNSKHIPSIKYLKKIYIKSTIANLVQCTLFFQNFHLGNLSFAVRLAKLLSSETSEVCDPEGLVAGGCDDDLRLAGSALVQLLGTLTTQRLWKFRPQPSHFRP
jgi:hypothetical protein